MLRAGLDSLAAAHPGLFDDVRGRGMIQGISTTAPEVAGEITAKAFERGLVIETAGSEGEVVKLLPPLVVDDAAIEQAFEILADSVDAVVEQLGDDLRSVVEVAS